MAADSPADFYIDLTRNSAFPDKVNDIVVECGNSLYQTILDRHIAGEDVPLSEVRQAWRNTTLPSCGFSIFYEQFYPMVRRIDEKRPLEKKLRVLAADRPVNWSMVNSPEDLEPFLERDELIASVTKKEGLSKYRKALMIFRTNHLKHGISSNSVGIYEMTIQT